MFSIRSFIAMLGGLTLCLLGWSGSPRLTWAQEVDVPKDVIEVSMVGTLDAQVFAIGGETTGVVISSKGITWELDFGDQPNLRELANQLHGTKVRVQGELAARKGIEIQQRWMVNVASLQPALPTPMQEGMASYLDDRGYLLHALEFTDSQTGFAGRSGSVLTLEPEGSWKYQTFLNDEKRPAERSGKLETEEIRQLVAVMVSVRFGGLKEKMGTSPQVNPHELSLKWGATVRTLTLRGGEVPPTIREGVDVTPEMRFGAVLMELRKLCNNP